MRTLPIAALVIAYASIFGLALIGKLDMWERWTGFARGLLPFAPLAETFRIGVPIAEGLVLATLFIRPVAGSIAAIALLFAFAIGLLVLLPRNRGRECGCFGAFASSRISWSLVGRNVALAMPGLGILMSARGQIAEPASPFGQVPTVVLIVLLTMLLHAYRKFHGSTGGSELMMRALAEEQEML